MGRSASVYETLASTARSWGYTAVTGSAVHDWRKRGLLPGVIVRHTGFGETRTEIPAEVVERLRAICSLRYDREVRDLRVLGLILWIDGADLRIEAMRNGALAAATLLSRHLQRTGSHARSRDEDDPNADLDAAAVRLAQQRPPLAERFHGEHVDGTDLAVAASEFLGGMSGRTPAQDLDPAALEPLGRAMGLHRAGVEAPPGADPWLSASPGTALVEAATAVNEKVLVARIQAATKSDFIAALETTRVLLQSLNRAARFLAIAASPGEFGLGFLIPFASDAPLTKAFLFLTTLAMPEQALVAAESYQRTTANAEALIELGEQWLREHPERAAEAKERGLLAVVSATRSDTLDS